MTPHAPPDTTPDPTWKYFILLPAAAMLFLAACVVGPNYKRPSATAPPVFKEPPPPNFKEAEAAGWKQAQPGDAYLKGKWWRCTKIRR